METKTTEIPPFPKSERNAFESGRQTGEKDLKENNWPFVVPRQESWSDAAQLQWLYGWLVGMGFLIRNDCTAPFSEQDITTYVVKTNLRAIQRPETRKETACS